MLLSLTRKVAHFIHFCNFKRFLFKQHLPDTEFMMNLGDWPLEKRSVSDNPIPIISWFVFTIIVFLYLIDSFMQYVLGVAPLRLVILSYQHTS